MGCTVGRNRDTDYSPDEPTAPFNPESRVRVQQWIDEIDVEECQRIVEYVEAVNSKRESSTTDGSTPCETIVPDDCEDTIMLEGEDDGISTQRLSSSNLTVHRTMLDKVRCFGSTIAEPCWEPPHSSSLVTPAEAILVYTNLVDDNTFASRHK